MIEIYCSAYAILGWEFKEDEDKGGKCKVNVMLKKSERME